MLIFFGGKNSRVDPLKIVVKKVVRGNAVQIFFQFSRQKSYYIYRANFFDTFVINFNKLIKEC